VKLKLNYKYCEFWSFGSVLSYLTKTQLFYLNQTYTLSLECQFEGYLLIKCR